MDREVGHPVRLDAHQVSLHQDLRRHAGVLGRNVEVLQGPVDEVGEAIGGEPFWIRHDVPSFGWRWTPGYW